MKVTYDRSADAAYIYLTSLGAGDVTKTYPCDPIEVGGEIYLDFDSSGRLVGIEVMDAHGLLPKDILDNAEILD